MAVLFEQLQNLYVNHLYDDVLYMASTLLTYSDRNPDIFTSSIRFQILYYQGMANFHIGSYKMAEASFNAALHIRKVHKLKGKKGTELQTEADVRFALHKCYLKTNNPVEALATLETIPSNQRTAEMHVSYIKLLSLNKSIKNNKSITAACKEIVKSNPLSIFGIKTLVRCGLSFEEIDQLIKSSLPQFNTIEWLMHIIRAFICVENCDYVSAIDLFSRVVSDPLSLFANNVVLTNIAEAYYLKGDYQRCIATFKQIQETDQNFTNQMGIYAYVLHRESHGAELKKLAGQLMHCNKESADVWTVLGFHQLLLQKYTQAFAFAQKALSIEANSVEALLLKGLSSMELKGETTESVLCFRLATRFAPTHFEPYKCIVDFYVSTESYQLATTAACEIHKLLPCARTYALYASVLIKDTNQTEKAKTMLESALQMDNTCLDAVLLLARVHKNQGNMQAAVDVLDQYPPNYQSYKYHQLMADVLIIAKDKLRALDHSGLALKLDPLVPKVLNFESSAEILDESDWYNGSAMPSRNLFREGVLAESPIHDQDLVILHQ